MCRPPARVESWKWSLISLTAIPEALPHDIENKSHPRLNLPERSELEIEQAIHLKKLFCLANIYQADLIVGSQL